MATPHCRLVHPRPARVINMTKFKSFQVVRRGSGNGNGNGDGDVSGSGRSTEALGKVGKVML